MLCGAHCELLTRRDVFLERDKKEEQHSIASDVNSLYFLYIFEYHNKEDNTFSVGPG